MSTQPSADPGAFQPSGCPAELPFRASYFPPGVKPQLRTGAGGGASPNTQVVEFHYEGPQGVFIDMRRGGAFFPVDEPTPIGVLGETAEFGSIHNGVGLNFQTRGGRCGRYEVSAYGLDRDEVLRFAEGLRSR